MHGLDDCFELLKHDLILNAEKLVPFSLTSLQQEKMGFTSNLKNIIDEDLSLPGSHPKAAAVASGPPSASASNHGKDKPWPSADAKDAHKSIPYQSEISSHSLKMGNDSAVVTTRLNSVVS